MSDDETFITRVSDEPSNSHLTAHPSPLTPQSSPPFDLIIVGSGIAGLYAALLATLHGRVLLVTKEALEESNTRYAQGGIAVAMAPGDSPELHLRDTIAAGDGLCDPQSVAILTADAPDCIRDLLARGVPFDREGRDLAWTREAAHTLPRILHAGGDATGAGIERTLAGAVRQAGVQIQEHVLCTSLMTGGGRVAGVRLLLGDGETIEVRASAVILATGGAGQLYARTTNPAVATGDGQAIAFRAGVALADLEFMQFHPTALAIDGAPSFLISEAVRGEGGILRDQTGRAFMQQYHPDRELAPRDVVARAIHRQMMETESPHVFLDIRHLPTELVERRFPSIVSFCRRHGVDPVHDLLPVSPAAHYWMGGIWTDAWGRTTLPGLYACGEVACTGVHGANRLASNSLLEGLVFAHRAVTSIVRADATVPRPVGSHLPTVPPPIELSNPAMRPLLATTMWNHMSLIRSAESISHAQQALESAGASLRACPPPQDQGGPVEPHNTPDPIRARKTHETRNLALLASLLIHTASLREESRGAHFRADFPQADPARLGHILVSRDGTRFLPLDARVEAGSRLCA